MLYVKPLKANYLGNKTKHMGLFYRTLQGDVPKFCDLTSGSNIVPLFFAEHRNTKALVLNDVSEYPRLISEALCCPPIPIGKIAEKIYAIEPRAGWMSNSTLSEAKLPFDQEVKEWIDGAASAWKDDPLLLTSLAFVLTESCTRWATVGFHVPTCRAFTVESLQGRTYKRAAALQRRNISKCDVTITCHNYLNLSKEVAKSLRGFVVYLDAAWPTQASTKTLSIDKTYGFYAGTLMSVLRQRDVALPKEYGTTEDECYEGIRETIRNVVAHGSKFLLAYQSKDKETNYAIETKVLDGLNYEYAEELRHGQVDYMECLWKIEA